MVAAFMAKKKNIGVKSDRWMLIPAHRSKRCNLSPLHQSHIAIRHPQIKHYILKKGWLATRVTHDWLAIGFPNMATRLCVTRALDFTPCQGTMGDTTCLTSFASMMLMTLHVLEKPCRVNLVLEMISKGKEEICYILTYHTSIKRGRHRTHGLGKARIGVQIMGGMENTLSIDEGSHNQHRGYNKGPPILIMRGI